MGLRQLFLMGTVLIISLAAQAVEVQELHSFPSIPVPNSVLVQDSSGAFYGTTYGGDFGFGTIYRATTNGTIQTLVSFNSTNGSYPNEPMVFGPDGALYGTTQRGGDNDYGTVFRLTTNGDLTTLASFFITNGASPQSGLIYGNDGAFYGTTSFGGLGSPSVGTLFRVTTNGLLTTLASFPYSVGTNQFPNGYSPGALAIGDDGGFYGVTLGGGAYNSGTIFRISTNGTLSTLASFNDTNGQKSEVSLLSGSNGIFYGTTLNYASQTDTSLWSGSSSLFQFGTNGNLTTVAEYTNGMGINAGLAQTGNGLLYGISGSYVVGTNYFGGAIIRWDTRNEAVTLVPLTNWDVYSPQSGLTVGQDGALYGTMYGGNNNYGAVIRVTTNGELRAVASFQYTNGADPDYELVEAPNGMLYGTTSDGGTHNFGTLYSITLNGTFKTLVDFDFQNGAHPFGGLVAGEDGVLYGITGSGGTNGAGTIFKFTTNGILTTLVSFNYTNIGGPVTGLTRDNDDSFYGLTSIYDPGGSNWETLFCVTSNGNWKALASFSITNGAYPSRLACGADGALYGTTYAGGIYNTGTVFRVTTNGDFTTLVSFDGTNGSNPQTALTFGEDGAFYGTTSRGGSDNIGTIFRVTTNGDLMTLYSFKITQAEGYPYTDLIPDGHGAFYGNAQQMFRVTTNGILTWLTPNLYVAGSGSLVHASDGWYYGFGNYSGRVNSSIYRMNPSIRMLPLTRGWKSWNVSFNGIPGDSYQVQRATTPLGPWETLTNAATDSNGDGHFNDGQPPVDRAFYRMKTP